MDNQNNITNEQLELLRRNLELSEEILKKTDYIRSYVKWQKIWGVFNILIIAIPIIIGIVYLPPLIREYLEQFTSLI